jgi:predicted TIM-barrel fold metal-dependent hydrolase
MMLDGHIHMNNINVDKSDFIKRLNAAGVDGGVIISIQPDSFAPNGVKCPAKERLEKLMTITKEVNNLYSFFWIDPLEEDALKQVADAVALGVEGFKVICNRFYPGDYKAMEVFNAIAENGKPILFHSGILWDGQASSIYNRPAGFEALLDIKDLKFCLAHISWPWIDECLAVYGKFLNAYSTKTDFAVEMFIDITPGTPIIYREEALKKLFTIGYDVENNIIFGSDCLVNNYNTNWVKDWKLRDNGIYVKLGIEDEITKKIYSENLLRFIGVHPKSISKKSLKCAEI